MWGCKVPWVGRWWSAMKTWLLNQHLTLQTPKLLLLTGFGSSHCRDSLIRCLSLISVTGSYQLLKDTSRTVSKTWGDNNPSPQEIIIWISFHIIKGKKYWLYFFLFWSWVVYSYFKPIQKGKLCFSLTPRFQWIWTERERKNLPMHSS